MTIGGPFSHGPLRPPEQVMRLSRMGASHPTRLSFMRSLIRRMAAEQARIEVTLNGLDAEGLGRATLAIDLGRHTYTLCCFTQTLAPEDRTDRVIAESWDAVFVLFDGVPDDADLDRLQVNATRQEAGRYLPSDLVLSRANKSMRLFDHVVDALKAGRRPDAEMIDRIGYLMRTTAVYGNGKFGIADRARIAARPGLGGPFAAEMLTVYLIRAFTLMLVEHIAGAPLPRDQARALGVGNATGLGMAPFLWAHPCLLNNWVLARETALARVRAVSPDQGTRARFSAMLARAQVHVAGWRVEDARQTARIAALEQDLQALAAEAPTALEAEDGWDRLIAFSDTLSVEAQEMTIALVLEPHGALVDGLDHCMDAGPTPPFDPRWPLSRIRAAMDERYDWVAAIDFSDPEAQRRFWYISEAKLEPRIGDRFAEPGADRESPLHVARDMQALMTAIDEAPPDQSAGALAADRPDLRHALHRVQTASRLPYGEIRDNLIGANCLPIDMLRFKLAFFGASRFDPKSDLWTRVTLFAGVPLGDELTPLADDWAFPAPLRS